MNFRTGFLAPGVAAAALFLAGCSDDPPSPVGVWSPDDGTGVKQISADGRCSGMFYLGPNDTLDIGGPMTCQFGTEPDDNGRYLLLVTQSMNSAQYRVDFEDGSTMALFDGGQRLVTLTRE